MTTHNAHSYGLEDVINKDPRKDCNDDHCGPP